MLVIEKTTYSPDSTHQIVAVLNELKSDGWNIVRVSSREYLLVKEQ